jgi:predicted phosphate transport protein (TIGR00153 family)
MVLFKTSAKIIHQVEDFFGNIEQGALTFKKGVYNYLEGNSSGFQENIESIVVFERKADDIRHSVENNLYQRSLLPQHRGDILKLIDSIDDIVDMSKEILFQFDVEKPNIPVQLHNDYRKITTVTVSAIENLMSVARLFFTEPSKVRDSIHMVYKCEKEADKLALKIKREVFSGELGISLSEKFHLRYFTLHIENLSDLAEDIADLLNIMAIKRIV